MPLVRTPTVEIAYEETGAANGKPAILLHGFPDGPNAWDGVAGPLAEAGMRVIVPYLRGYGPTRLLDAATPRSGQQAALGADLRDLMEALDLGPAVLAGYDWGGRAACIVAALWPERVRGLVSIGGYNIQDIAACFRPAAAEREYAYWYQWYFQTERGRAGLAANRRDICRLLWRLWSPNWMFEDAVFERAAQSWDNPDFVDIVIHSYRHRHQAAPGDPAFDEIERMLAAKPPIAVPSVVLEGAADTVGAVGHEHPNPFVFPALRAHRVIPRAGHFLPHEAPDAVVDAVDLLLAAP